MEELQGNDLGIALARGVELCAVRRAVVATQARGRGWQDNACGLNAGVRGTVGGGGELPEPETHRCAGLVAGVLTASGRLRPGDVDTAGDSVNSEGLDGSGSARSTEGLVADEREVAHGKAVMVAAVVPVTKL